MTLAFMETAGTDEFSTIKTLNPLGKVSLWTSNIGRTPKSVGFKFCLLCGFGSITLQQTDSPVVLVQVAPAHFGNLLGRYTGNVPNIRIDIVESADCLHLAQKDSLIQRTLARQDKMCLDLVF